MMKAVLACVSLLGLAAIAGAVVVGGMSFEGLVVERPYEEGLQWDSANALRESSGLRVALADGSVRVGPNNLEVKVEGRGGDAYEGPVLLRLSRPDTQDFDRTYEAAPKGPGLYAARAELPLQGRWVLDVRVVALGNEISFRRTLYAER